MLLADLLLHLRFHFQPFFFYCVYVLYELSGHPSLLVSVYVLSGSTPYENIRGRDLPGRLKKGERLPKPENSDDT